MSIVTRWRLPEPTRAERFAEGIRSRRDKDFDPEELRSWRRGADRTEEWDYAYKAARRVVTDFTCPLKQRYAAAKEILRRYHFISWKRAEYDGCERIHPDFRTHVKFLDVGHIAFGFPADVVELLRRRFPPVPCPDIDRGDYVWWGWDEAWRQYQRGRRDPQRAKPAGRPVPTRMDPRWAKDIRCA